ncbi:hypothetical protein H9L39_12140 [Fusarium oxysporum f. sp. albedinis]|nr:hypothetical protein H9L39_12140 [Fusarium oxysporum f. sp. albedinis]
MTALSWLINGVNAERWETLRPFSSVLLEAECFQEFGDAGAKLKRSLRSFISRSWPLPNAICPQLFK